MYRVVRASILYYEEYMQDCKARYKLIKPYLLLLDSKLYAEEKKQYSSTYKNLCNIVVRMRELYLSGEPKYHHFDMLIKELEALGFDLSDIKPSNTSNPELLREQIDLLLQFLAYRYPFDQYDNKTGVHDIHTNEFIFIQP